MSRGQSKGKKTKENGLQKKVMYCLYIVFLYLKWVSTIDAWYWPYLKQKNNLQSIYSKNRWMTYQHKVLIYFMFLEDIKLVSVVDKFLVSFDAANLFTNILLSEAIDTVINLSFENSLDIKFTKCELQKVFRIATSETYFTFNGSIYDQIDGVAMSSPLASVLVNLFIGFHEQNWMEQATNVKPMFYKRFVDDIFAVIESESDANVFYSYLNTRHQNIKFSFENKKNNKLAFSDILINNTEFDLKTSVFHKKTYTGLLLNCFSFVSNHKIHWA